jgi:acyl carrier protein
MQTIRHEIRAFIIENFLFGQADSPLGPGDSFLEGGILDSTGVLELVGFLEERFAITVADDEMIPDNLDSVERVAQFVERKLQLGASLAS